MQHKINYLETNLSETKQSLEEMMIKIKELEEINKKLNESLLNEKKERDKDSQMFLQENAKKTDEINSLGKTIESLNKNIESLNSIIENLNLEIKNLGMNSGEIVKNLTDEIQKLKAAHIVEISNLKTAAETELEQTQATLNKIKEDALSKQAKDHEYFKNCLKDFALAYLRGLFFY